MNIIFEVIEKSGRKIRLTREQWKHIKQKHPNVEDYEIEITLKNPSNVLYNEEDDVWMYHTYFKQKKQISKYLRVLVKYLNGGGYVITAYFVRTLN